MPLSFGKYRLLLYHRVCVFAIKLQKAPEAAGTPHFRGWSGFYSVGIARRYFHFDAQRNVGLSVDGLCRDADSGDFGAFIR